MTKVLSEEAKKDLLSRGFTRRSFGRIATLLSAGATLPFYTEGALAQLSNSGGPIPADAVKIDANENPLGPCAEAQEAIYSVVKQGGRYMYEETATLRKVFAEQNNLKQNYVEIYAGSSAPLHQAVLAFCSPTRSYVTADPGYESGVRAAKYIGAKVINVPLKKDYSHDVKAMVSADSNAGLIYLCNPNNPTGTMTSRADVEWAIANKPKGSIVLLDEAYLHFSKLYDQNGLDLVAAGKDVVVLRTFSKLYGMAGLRAGLAAGRPDLLEKVSQFSAGAMPITAMVGATASLKAKNLIAERRKIVADTRESVFAFLEKHNFTYIKSDDNKFMMDVKRPAKEFQAAMRQYKIYVGRTWPVWPTYSRITIGTPEEMKKFEDALLKVMA